MYFAYQGFAVAYPNRYAYPWLVIFLIREISTLPTPTLAPTEEC